MCPFPSYAFLLPHCWVLEAGTVFDSSLCPVSVTLHLMLLYKNWVNKRLIE